MKVETVALRPQPMLYLTRRSGMDPAAISRAMGEMFAAMGAFIGERNPPVAGPPMAIYRDHAADGVTIDLGFPVAEAGAALQGGEVKAGSAPGGKGSPRKVCSRKIVASMSSRVGSFCTTRNSIGPLPAMNAAAPRSTTTQAMVAQRPSAASLGAK